MPKADDGSTVGCTFIKYKLVGDAKKAMEVLEGRKFDKNHSLHVTPYKRATHLEEVEEGEF